LPRVLSSFLLLLLAIAPAPAQEANPNTRFGMPAAAKANPVFSREAFLISRPQYVLSYNYGPGPYVALRWKLAALALLLLCFRVPRRRRRRDPGS
jgi:hypothetical protein